MRATACTEASARPGSICSTRRREAPASIPLSAARTTGTEACIHSRYRCASAGATARIDSTVCSIERWKRTTSPPAWNATENGSISRYSSPASASRSSAGMSVMLMMLCAAEWVSNR